MVQIRAGLFSAAMSADQQLFVWGQGIFGEFYTPHRVKSVNKLDILDFVVSKGGVALVLTRQGTLYSWGYNDFGQLGHGDYKERATPERIDALDQKRVTQVAVGHDFIIALGLTLPQKEYDRIIRNSSGVLGAKKSLGSTKASKQMHGGLKHSTRDNRSVSTKRGTGRTKSQMSKKYLHSHLSEFNKFQFSNSQMSFNNKRGQFNSGEKERSHNSRMPHAVPNSRLLHKLDVKMPRKSKSSSKLSSMTGAKRAYITKARKDYLSHHKSPLRSSRNLSRTRMPESRRSPTRSDDTRTKTVARTFDQTNQRDQQQLTQGDGDNRSSSHRQAKKEPSPIIIHRGEQLAYKAPSSIHETVVHTLRREKDNLALALQNQRETNLSLTKQVSNLGLRSHELEAENARLNSMSNEDQRNVEILDHRHQEVVRELD